MSFSEPLIGHVNRYSWLQNLGQEMWVTLPHLQSCRLLRSGSVGSHAALQDPGSLPLTLQLPPCCDPLPHHHLFFRSLLGSLSARRPMWSSLSSNREEFRLSLPCALICPTFGMGLGRNRTQGPSGLSVGD